MGTIWVPYGSENLGCRFDNGPESIIIDGLLPTLTTVLIIVLVLVLLILLLLLLLLLVLLVLLLVLLVSSFPSSGLGSYVLFQSHNILSCPVVSDFHARRPRVTRTFDASLTSATFLLHH